MGRTTGNTSAGFETSAAESELGIILSKTVTSNVDYIQSTVRATDLQHRYNSVNVDLWNVLERATGMASVCASKNATTANSVPLRLYRPVDSSAPKGVYRNGKTAWQKLDSKTAQSVRSNASVYAPLSGSLAEVTSHPVLNLLRKPNPLSMRGSEFVWFALYMLDIAGNVFLHAARDSSGKPVELYHLLPQYVSILPDEERFIGGYVYARDFANKAYFETNDVFHFRRRPARDNPYYGVSWLHELFLESDIRRLARLNELALWHNSARPDYALLVDESYNDDNIEAMRSQLNKHHQGVAKAGNFAILRAKQIQQLNFAPKDLQYDKGMRLLNQEIWQAAGIPESIMLLNNANLASSTTGDNQYHRHTIKPLQKQLAEELTETLLADFTGTEGWFFAFDEIVVEDQATLNAEVRADVASGLRTINEGRIERGLEPIDDPNADRPMINGVPLGVTPFGAGTPNADPLSTQSADTANERLDRIEAMLSSLATNIETQSVHAGHPRPLPINGQENEEYETTPVAGGHPSDLPIERDDKAAENIDTKAVADDDLPFDTDLPNALYQDLERWYANLAEGVEFAADGTPMFDDSQRAELQRALDDHLPELVQGGVEGGLEALAAIDGGQDRINTTNERIEGAFNIAATEARQAARERVPELAASVWDEHVERAQEASRAIVERFIAEGQSISDATAAIRREFQDNTKYEAERLARTESAFAYTEGQRSTWRAADIERHRFLLSPNPCEVCKTVARMNPRPIPIDQPFWALGQTINVNGRQVTNSYIDRFGGPLHPGCRCDSVPVID